MPETGVSERVTLVPLAHVAVDINGDVWISRDQRAAIGGLSLIAADGSLTTDGDRAVWPTETVDPSA
jgi:hypothetical protein